MMWTTPTVAAAMILGATIGFWVALIVWRNIIDCTPVL